MKGGHERHWMTRAKSTTKYRVIQRLGAGDELVELQVSREARKKDPTLPQTYVARAIRFQRKGYRPTTLLTSLVDPKTYPAAELRVLYHERWEIELGFGEIKTDMLERLETIRSKSPSAVEQEMWGLLIAYNLVRLEMERIAKELDVAPTRISFVAALRFFVEQVALGSIHRDAGRDPAAPLDNAGPSAAVSPAGTTPRPCLSTSGEDQDEQLPEEGAALVEEAH
jgi:hypothetical protein